MVGYLNSNGDYYEGDRIGTDEVVPRRPDHEHEWLNGEWKHVPPTQIEEQSPIEKLREFLAANPDVAELIGQ